MPRKGIREIRERIRTKNYEFTGHAEEEREDDDLSVADLQGAILIGQMVQTLTGICVETGTWYEGKCKMGER
jgi:hypothetical protein